MINNRLNNVDYKNVDITNGFWFDKQKLVEKVTLEAIYDRFKETGRFEALKQNWKEGMPFKPHIFWESDITKWIEGCAYFLAKKRDAKVEKMVDDLVDLMEKAQADDGYLNVYFTVVEPGKRFTYRTHHELYCAGHLVEAALTYNDATKKDKLLKIAIKYIDLIDDIFRVKHSAAFDTPGHEEIELALIKLYEYTKEERYKKLSEYFVDTRGTSNRDETYDFADQEHMQSHLPVREVHTAEGHSVRALYLYCAMADLANENSDDSLYQVCLDLYENIINKRMYITGGVGSNPKGETFTFDYDLPPYTAYNETCASIALMLFCSRMWKIDNNSKYGDTFEQALYNTVLSGISLSGDKFFYENPLAANPEKVRFNDSRPPKLRDHLPILERVKVFECSCCPPNLLRIIGSLSNYIYSINSDTIYVQNYIDSKALINIDNEEIQIKQNTLYPYDGKIELSINANKTLTLALRIPAWCKNYSIEINNEIIDFKVVNGYAIIKHDWDSSDKLVLSLEMQVKFIEANSKVVDYAGRVAVTRGPLVYCAEALDNNDYSLSDIKIKRNTKIEVGEAQVDNNTVPIIKLEATRKDDLLNLYREYRDERVPITLTLIPYFAWANRKVSEMETWFLI
ncbi:MAG: glycoside hydrolase family 127 protein [Pleomorphochaeta sp.]